MNTSINLHDSELTSLSWSDGCTTIVLNSACVHETPGNPGFDAGRIWLQNATLRFEGTVPFALRLELPLWVYGGVLRVEDTEHQGFLPVCCFDDSVVEFCLSLSTAEGSNDAGSFQLRGTGVRIELTGEPSTDEEFKGPPWHMA